MASTPQLDLFAFALGEREPPPAPPQGGERPLEPPAPPAPPRPAPPPNIPPPGVRGAVEEWPADADGPPIPDHGRLLASLHTPAPAPLPTTWAPRPQPGDSNVSLGDVIDDDAPLTQLAPDADWAGQGGTGVAAVDTEQGMFFPEMAVATSSLAARLIVPPFSVLDTQQEYWQKRKRAWLQLGIKSELGRGNDLLSTGTGSVYNGTAAYAQAAVKDSDGKGTATSIFDPVLCEVAYRWWSPQGGRVLDPFAGGSVRGVVAGHLGRAYLGVDLSTAQVAANRAQWAELGEQCDTEVQWADGDSAQLTKVLEAAGYHSPFDMVFTCPPYFNLERYSDDPADLSNASSWDRFAAMYRVVVTAALAALAPNRFSVWVVGNLRDDQGRVLDLAGLTVAAHEDAGAHLYNDACLLTAIGTLPMRTAAQFPRGRKVGRRHQSVLAFWKGDPKAVEQHMGPLQGWAASDLAGE